MTPQIKILFEDNDMIVCIKPIGTPSEENGRDGMPDLLKSRKNEILTVHRLDTPVSGIMVYAKNKPTADSLTKQMQDGTFEKEYLAVASGHLEKQEDTFIDYLFHDKRVNKTFVVSDKKTSAKKAILCYRVIAETEDSTLLQIKLQTGRTHQIRVQFASRNHPLHGDGKYGSKVKGNIALFAYHLSFLHPKTQEKMHFFEMPGDDFPISLPFDDTILTQIKANFK